ncbi:MAG: hypothetical protein LC137_10440, partial [Burkholderiales bacterium]|nr:hypothetical protein [Burkholderiales bacterium]
MTEPLPPPEDALRQRYREAAALEGRESPPALRTAVLAQASALARERAARPVAPGPADATETTLSIAAGAHPASAGAGFDLKNTAPRRAANDAHWLRSALASLAVLALATLLVLQFDRGTPEERELALGQGRPPAPAAQVEPPPAQTPAAASAERPATAPTPATAARAPTSPAPAQAPSAPRAAQADTQADTQAETQADKRAGAKANTQAAAPAAARRERPRAAPAPARPDPTAPPPAALAPPPPAAPQALKQAVAPP